MKPCVLAEYPHGFVPDPETGQPRCEGCGEFLDDLVEDGECTMCGESHPEAMCSWTE